nr:AraC family transcriptional regulator [uncultured Acetatifactor sp.]
MEKAFKLDFENDKAGSLYVNCCGCSQTESLHSFGPASKPHYLIHYVLSGRGLFRFHDKEYKLEAGYGFLIQPNKLAFYQADERDPWSYLWVGFAGNRAGEYLKAMGLSERHPVFACDRSEELYAIVKDMMEHNTFGIANDLRRNGLMGVFLSVLAENAGVVAGQEEDKGNQYVKKAVSFIQSNYCNPIKVTDVAEFVCINRSYLYTLFQSYLGMSPQQFLTTFRITKARELLNSTDYPIESIALSCGYNDAVVFSKAFHAMKGMSPSQYRRESHKESTKEQLREVERLIAQLLEQNKKGVTGQTDNLTF